MRIILLALFMNFALPVTADENLEFFQCKEKKQQSYRNYNLGNEDFSNEYKMIEKHDRKNFVVRVNHALEEIALSSWERINGDGLLFYNCRSKRDNPETWDFKWTTMNVPLMYDEREKSIAATCIHATRPSDLMIETFFIDRTRNIFHYASSYQSHSIGGVSEKLEYFERYSVTGTCEQIPFKPEIITMASYLGTAEFCNAYGIDYRDLANKIINGTLKNTTFNVAFTEADFLEAVERGNFGEIYSVERGDFVSIPAESDDPFEGCKRTHLEVMKISKLK